MINTKLVCAIFIFYVTRKRHKQGLSMRLRKRSKGCKPVQMADIDH